MATDISAEGCLFWWVAGVASSGTFVKNALATRDVTGVSGILEGWNVTLASDKEFSMEDKMDSNNTRKQEQLPGVTFFFL